MQHSTTQGDTEHKCILGYAFCIADHKLYSIATRKVKQMEMDLRLCSVVKCEAENKSCLRMPVFIEDACLTIPP